MKTWSPFFIFIVFVSTTQLCCAAEISTDDNVDVVITWLKKFDFANRENPHAPPKEKCDIQGWLAEGRALPKISKILDTLLRTKDSRIDIAEAVFSIGHLGNKENVPTLLEYLTNENLIVRIETATALGALGDEGAVDSLISSLEKDSDKNVRATAASSLGRIGGKRCEDALKAATNDKNAFVANVASRALERLQKNASRK